MIKAEQIKASLFYLINNLNLLLGLYEIFGLGSQSVSAAVYPFDGFLLTVSLSG
jgi:hypothetical protein